MELYAPESLNGARLLGVYDAGSPEWHAERANGIGGSEVGTILGLNPYESAYALWAKRTGRIPSRVTENWAIRFGKAFEEPILHLWEEEHPEYEVFATGTYADEHDEYLHANPDAIARHRETGELMILEVKTARTTWSEIPPGYIAQVLHYMGVLKIQQAQLVAVAGMTWNEFAIPFSQGAIEYQNEKIRKFWRSILQDEKPDWDGSESTYNAVRQEHPEIELREVELGELGVELAKAQKVSEEATQRLLKAKSQVLDTMGTAKWGTIQIDKNQIHRVASRQLRGGSPVLITNTKGVSWT